MAIPMKFPVYVAYPPHYPADDTETETEDMFSDLCEDSRAIAIHLDDKIRQLFGAAMKSTEAPSFGSIYGPMESKGGIFADYRAQYNRGLPKADRVLAGLLGLYHMYTDRDAKKMAEYRKVWSRGEYMGKASIVYAHTHAEYLFGRWESMRNPDVSIFAVIRKRFESLRGIANELASAGRVCYCRDLPRKLLCIASTYYINEMDYKKWSVLYDVEMRYSDLAIDEDDEGGLGTMTDVVASGLYLWIDIDGELRFAAGDGGMQP